MDGNTSLIRAKIREAIDKGTLTKDSMESGLQALIDEEIHQNERPANQELIQACLNLIDELNAAPEYARHHAQALSCMKARAAAYNRLRRFAQYARRVAVIAVIILVGSFSVSLFGGQDELIARPTEDEQQYQIQGHVTKTGAVAVGQSGELETVTETTTLEKAIELLGFDPSIPKWIPDGWSADHFTVSITPLSEQLHLAYRCDTENESIQYDVIRYFNAEISITNYEQSLNGTSQIWNGREVYISNNMGNSIAVWTEDTTQYSISAPLTPEEIRKIIESI